MATHEAPATQTPEGRAPAPEKPWGLVGYFGSPTEIYKACEALRDSGYRKFDAYTPFPVHGLENAMGIKPSRLGWIVLACGITGFSSALLMMIYMNVWDYPLVIGGKPYMTIPSYVPITFELTILFSAFGAFFGQWGLNGLPKYFDPVMQHPSFDRVTDDRFFISVSSEDPNYDQSRTRGLLEGLGARELAEVQP